MIEIFLLRARQLFCLSNLFADDKLDMKRATLKGGGTGFALTESNQISPSKTFSSLNGARKKKFLESNLPEEEIFVVK